MTWKQIKHPDDPNWVEWYKETTNPSWGRVILRVWQDEAIRGSITSDEFDHVAVVFDVSTIEEAKKRAEQWVKVPIV